MSNNSGLLNDITQLFFQAPTDLPSSYVALFRVYEFRFKLSFIDSKLTTHAIIYPTNSLPNDQTLLDVARNYQRLLPAYETLEYCDVYIIQYYAYLDMRSNYSVGGKYSRKAYIIRRI